jgi:hypothetical protein
MELAHRFLLPARIREAATTGIRDAAPGHVSLRGTLGVTAPEHPRRAPISQAPCVWYRVWVEQLHRTGGAARWVKVFEESDPRPILLQDESGHCVIVPESGMPRIGTTVQTWEPSSPASSLPDALRAAGAARWLGCRLRFGEERLEPGPALVSGRLDRTDLTTDAVDAAGLLDAYGAWCTDYLFNFGGDPADLAINPRIERRPQDMARRVAAARWVASSTAATGPVPVVTLEGKARKPTAIVAGQALFGAPLAPLRWLAPFAAAATVAATWLTR